jgi:hypothetical protein
VTSNRDSIDASYYQKLHDAGQAFMVNHCLLTELVQLRNAKATHSILELGCGNDRQSAIIQNVDVLEYRSMWRAFQPAA